MYSRRLVKYTSNPIIGLLPFLVYIILHAVNVTEWCSLLIAIGTSISCDLTIRRIFKTRAFSLAYYLLDIAFIVTLLVYLLAPDAERYGRNIYIVICEISIVTLYIALGIGSTFVKARWLRNKSIAQKALLERFYSSATAIQHVFTLHLFLILLSKYMKDSGHSSDLFSLFLYTILPCLFITGLFVYESAKMNNVWAKLKKEEWLPIVTAKGEVTGKIARSVSQKMKNRFMHPVVRVALVCNGKVFLQERSLDSRLSPAKLDYPFEKYVLFKHEINVAARNSIAQMLNYSESFPLIFLLKYEFENEETNRLNIVYVSEIEDENMIKRDNKMFGKFWSMKQIEEGFADEVFSECFELEYEYLKNKALLNWNERHNNTNVKANILDDIKDSSSASRPGTN